MRQPQRTPLIIWLFAFYTAFCLSYIVMGFLLKLDNSGLNFTRILTSSLMGGIAVVVTWCCLRILLLRRDGLTGCFLRLVAEEKMVKASRQNRDVTIALIDINQLKATNDIWGHEFGDELIKHVGKILVDNFGDRHSLVARMGGDEFIVMSRKKNTGQMIRELQKILAESHQFGRFPLGCAGVARTRLGRTRYALNCADRAMYRSKKNYKATGKAIVYEYDVVLDGIPDGDMIHLSPEPAGRPPERLRDRA